MAQNLCNKRDSAFWGVLLFLVVLPQFSRGGEAKEFFGPMPTRNYAPPQMLFLGMEMERARLLPPQDWRFGLLVAESNTILEESFTISDVHIDLETTSLFFDLAYGVTDRLEAGVEIPVIFRHRGFLDPFSFAVEDLVDKMNPLREERPDFDYLYFVDVGGERVLGGEKGGGLGDISLKGKFRFLEEGEYRPYISFRTVVKLPTGRRSQAFGSDHVDLGFGLRGEKGVGPLNLYGNANGVFPTGRFEPEVVTTDPFFTGGFAIEYRFAQSALVVQFQFYDSPYRVDIETMDPRIFETLEVSTFELISGLKFRLAKEWVWSFGFVENFATEEAAADFSLFTGLEYQRD